MGVKKVTTEATEEQTVEKKKVIRKKTTTAKKKVTKKSKPDKDLILFIVAGKPDATKECGFDIQEFYMDNNDYKTAVDVETDNDTIVLYDKDGNAIDLLSDEFLTSLMTYFDMGSYDTSVDSYVITPSIGNVKSLGYIYTTKRIFNMGEYNISIYGYGNHTRSSIEDIDIVMRYLAISYVEKVSEYVLSGD